MKAVKLISRKLLDLLESHDLKGLEYDIVQTYCHTDHGAWATKLMATIEQLRKWELRHVGGASFSQAFDMLGLQLQVQDRKNKKSVTRMSQQKSSSRLEK